MQELAKTDISEKPKVITVHITDEDISKLAAAVMNEFTKQFQINVGKGILEYLWKAFLAICLIALVWSAKGNFK